VIGLDSNVLIRYFVQDEPGQARRADALIHDALDRGDRCAVSLIVLCEIVWVLRDSYRQDRATIAVTIEQILDAAEFVVEDSDVARQALGDYRRGPGDFADYVIGRRNLAAGCEKTATFDRGLRGSPLFRVL
jgi:predicted nucleic-acid-binding protein